MSKGTCRYCGLPVDWHKTKHGKLAPFDIEPRLHIISCKKRPKAEKSDQLLALTGLGYSVTEAREMLKQAKGDLRTALKGAER